MDTPTTSIKMRLREALNIRNMTQQELSDKTGIPKASISQYLSGYAKPKSDRIYMISSALNISEAWLLGFDVPIEGKSKHTEPPADIKTFDNLYPIEVHKYPMLGEIACGEPIFVNEERESYVLSGTKIDADFCLKAKGDSMIGARILDGDIVFIKETTMVENGDIAAVAINDEVLLKRFDYLKEENILALHSENPRYKTMRFSGEELDHIRVLGKAVAFQSDII